jgi:integrase
MSEGHCGAQGAIITAGAQAAYTAIANAQAGASCAVSTPADLSQAVKQKSRRKTKAARAQPYKTAAGTWSARTRRQGADIFLSGRATQAALEQELSERMAALAKRGKPYGEGPERTSVAKALQDHALKHLPSLKGADQEARRINKYLRAARLPTLQVRLFKEGSDRQGIPEDAKVGAHCAVWLQPYTSARAVPEGLGEHRKKLLTRTGGSDRARSVLAEMKVAEVTYEFVQDLVQHLEAEGLAKASVMQEVALLKRLFNHASGKWHWVKPAKNPACRLKLAGELTKRERVMSKEEQRRLDEALETCMNSVVGREIDFLTETAMRADECRCAKWVHVDWDKCILRLEDAKAGARNVPLSPRAMEILRSLEPSTDPKKKIFGITYEALKAAWRRACERAGITDLHIQDLRHTAATRMALKSGNIFIVQKLTGHKTIEMVRRYVNVSADDVVAVLHAPQPTSSAAPAAAPMSQDALQAAMQMLQAAAAQLAASPSAQPAAQPPTHGPAANDAGASASSFASVATR